MASNPKTLIVRIGAASLIVIVVLFWIFGWSRPVAQVARVKSDMAANAVAGSVTVQAEYTMDLKSEIGGRVLESSLELDQHVRTGDVLMRIDSTDLKLEIEKIQNDYEAAKKTLAVGSSISLELDAARENLTNAERQRKAGIISDAELTRLKRQVQGIEQNRDRGEIANKLTLGNLENALKAKQRQLEKMTITAPFDGIVTLIYARKGDLIGERSPIARIIASGRLVEGRLSEENIAGVRVGQKAFVSFLPYVNQQFVSKVVKVLSSADPDTQRYPVHLEVQIDPARLLPGLTGEVSIILDERPSKAIVPRRSVIGDKLLVVNDGMVELRKVKVGYVSMTAVEILEGVSPGELVIMDQLDQFSDGKRVRPALTEDTHWR
ncbi:MAG: efflux RND transporter periplasmic adaptor subunit [Opitutaceae bacterium]|jgi:RND family efflux transporter MFP subunit